MTVPAIVQERLGGDEVTARVPLGGDDELFVTPARTLIYRAEGLLSGESVETYPHEAERVSVGEGRRKCTIKLDHGLDGESQFTIPADRFEEAIEPILRGVFVAAGITGGEEEITEVYRLGELTIVITDARVVKHVGNALWDEEFEEFPFEAVTGIDVEEGSVSSQIIVDVDGRPQRIKIPSDDARRIRSQIQDGVLSYHGFSSYEEFRRSIEADIEAESGAEASGVAAVAEANAEVETESETAATGAARTETEGIEAEGTEPADAEATETPAPTDAEGHTEDELAEPATDAERTLSGMMFGEEVRTVADAEDGDLADELAALRSAVERQNDLLRRNQRVIERLIRELKQDE